MKKFLSFLALSIGLIVSMVLFVACDDGHKHSYVDTVVAPTCTEQGYTTHVCECGNTTTNKYVAALGHNYQESVVSTATCVSNGSKKFTCSRCSNSYTQSYSLRTYTSEEIYSQAKDCAVEIITYDADGDSLALGSGFVYSSDGKIVTNYHVIEDACSADVYVGNTKYVVQKVLAYSKTKDIAVLKINASGLKTIPVCTKTHSTGSTVYALGSSRGLTSTFSKGIITSSSREIDGVKYVQHDAAISNGNSGGPLINEYLEIIGINTLTLKDSQNINFAIYTSELTSLSYGTALTLQELYDKESDVFTKVKNYIISNGKYDSSDGQYDIDFGYTTADSLVFKTGAYYDVQDKEITFTIYINSDGLGAMVFLRVDVVDGSYAWSYIDTYDQYMYGNVYGSTFTTSSYLSYTGYTGLYTTSLITSIRKLASSMMQLLLISMQSDYASIGFSAYDLGFIYYN